MERLGSSQRVLAVMVRASPRLTLRIACWLLVGAAATVAQLFALHRLVGDIGLEAVGDDLTDLAPSLAMVCTATFFSSLSAALLLEHRLLLAEDVGRALRLDLAAIAGRAELRHLDDPGFHDRLRLAHDAVSERVESLPWALVSTGLGGLGVAAVTIVLARLAPIVLLVILVASLPLLLVARFKSRVLFAFHYDETPADRRRAYLEAMHYQRRPAAELIAHGVRPELLVRMADAFVSRRRHLHAVYRQRRPAVIGSTLISVTGLAIALATMLILVDRGSIALADAAVAAVALNQLRTRLTTFSLGVEEIHQAASFVAIIDRLDAELPEPDPAPVIPAAPLDELVVDGIGFTYPGAERPTLTNIDLTLRPGQVTAVVGENGSGKTTLAKLVAGLYRPTTGEIRWNDGPLDEVLAGGQALVAQLFQDFNRYELSVSDNISLGDPARPPDRERIVLAAEAAGASEWIEHLPDGYDTMVSRTLSNGTELSGGQWQRLALARTIYRRSPIVVLDEPTAAQDALREAAFVDQLRAGLDGAAILLISHRLSVIAGADLIVVLDGGRLVEQGTHRQLMAADGPYRALFGAGLDPRSEELADFGP